MTIEETRDLAIAEAWYQYYMASIDHMDGDFAQTTYDADDKGEYQGWQRYFRETYPEINLESST